MDRSSSTTDLTRLAGATVESRDGQKIGKVVDVYESTDGGTAGTFVTVATGLFGTHASFVPLDEATRQGDRLVVPYDKELVKQAPRVDTDEELTSVEEERLYRHYSLLSGSTTTPAPVAPRAGTGSHDTGDVAMTRSEERLQVGTQTTETGRARLRKRVASEAESATVAVSHDEVRVVREPVTAADAGAALAGPDLSEEEHEVVLLAERPVVAKETVPVERVRLATETVREQAVVEEQVRKERIEVDGDVEPRRR